MAVTVTGDSVDPVDPVDPGEGENPGVENPGTGENPDGDGGGGTTDGGTTNVLASTGSSAGIMSLIVSGVLAALAAGALLMVGRKRKTA